MRSIISSNDIVFQSRGLRISKSRIIIIIFFFAFFDVRRLRSASLPLSAGCRPRLPPALRFAALVASRGGAFRVLTFRPFAGVEYNLTLTTLRFFWPSRKRALASRPRSSTASLVLCETSSFAKTASSLALSSSHNEFLLSKWSSRSLLWGGWNRLVAFDERGVCEHPPTSFIGLPSCSHLSSKNKLFEQQTFSRYLFAKNLTDNRSIAVRFGEVFPPSSNPPSLPLQAKEEAVDFEGGKPSLITLLIFDSPPAQKPVPLSKIAILPET